MFPSFYFFETFSRVLVYYSSTATTSYKHGSPHRSFMFVIRTKRIPVLIDKIGHEFRPTHAPLPGFRSPLACAPASLDLVIPHPGLPFPVVVTVQIHRVPRVPRGDAGHEFGQVRTECLSQPRADDMNVIVQVGWDAIVKMSIAWPISFFPRSVHVHQWLEELWHMGGSTREK